MFSTVQNKIQQSGGVLSSFSLANFLATLSVAQSGVDNFKVSKKLAKRKEENTASDIVSGVSALI